MRAFDKMCIAGGGGGGGRGVGQCRMICLVLHNDSSSVDLYFTYLT